MKTRLEVSSSLKYPDGTVVLAGKISGELLSAGSRGRAKTARGNVEIEVLSVAINNIEIYQPEFQSVQAKILEGDEAWLKDALIQFD